MKGRVMRRFILLLFIGAFINLALVMPAMAAKKSAKQQSPNQKEVTFDELLVQGKYHFSDEATATVEENKVLDALLDVRKDFKDRIKRSANLH